MRFEGIRFPAANDLAVDASTTRDGSRLNVLANGFTTAGVTVPTIVAPLPATNDTDAAGICALVTVTTCVPTVADSVHVTDDWPLWSVVVLAALNVPPPVTVHASGTPATAFPPPSSTRTTSAVSSADDTFADWLFPDTMTRVVGVWGMVAESWQAARAAAATASREDGPGIHEVNSIRRSAAQTAQGMGERANSTLHEERSSLAVRDPHVLHLRCRP